MSEGGVGESAFGRERASGSLGASLERCDSTVRAESKERSSAREERSDAQQRIAVDEEFTSAGRKLTEPRLSEVQTTDEDAGRAESDSSGSESSNSARWARGTRSAEDSEVGESEGRASFSEVEDEWTRNSEITNRPIGAETSSKAERSAAGKEGSGTVDPNERAGPHENREEWTRSVDFSEVDRNGGLDARVPREAAEEWEGREVRGPVTKEATRPGAEQDLIAEASASKPEMVASQNVPTTEGAANRNGQDEATTFESNEIDQIENENAAYKAELAAKVRTGQIDAGEATYRERRHDNELSVSMNANEQRTAEAKHHEEQKTPEQESTGTDQQAELAAKVRTGQIDSGEAIYRKRQHDNELLVSMNATEQQTAEVSQEDEQTATEQKAGAAQQESQQQATQQEFTEAKQEQDPTAAPFGSNGDNTQETVAKGDSTAEEHSPARITEKAFDLTQLALEGVDQAKRVLTALGVVSLVSGPVPEHAGRQLIEPMSIEEIAVEEDKKHEAERSDAESIARAVYLESLTPGEVRKKEYDRRLDTGEPR